MLRLLLIASLGRAAAKTGGPRPNGFTPADCPDWLHTSCFSGGEVGWPESLAPIFEGSPTPPGACVTCGYGSVDSVDDAYDCVTCEDGYEVVPIYEDCSGVCADKKMRKYLEDERYEFPWTTENCRAWTECDPALSGTYYPTYEPTESDSPPRPVPKPTEALGDCPELGAMDSSKCNKVDVDELPGCTDPCLCKGMHCLGEGDSRSKCFASKSLDNCEDGADVYEVLSALNVPGGDECPPCPAKRDCPALVGLTADECPADDAPYTDDCRFEDGGAVVGALCEASGECWTEGDWDTCGTKDFYRVVANGAGCPYLEVVAPGDCPDPDDVEDLPKCHSEPCLVAGEFCHGQGEENGDKCGAGKELKNCDAAGGGSKSVYRVTSTYYMDRSACDDDGAPPGATTPRPTPGAAASTYEPTSEGQPTYQPTSDGRPSPRPTSKPTGGRCQVLEAVATEACPEDGGVAHSTCDDPDLEVGEICQSDDGECDTSTTLNNCRYPEDALYREADLYRVVPGTSSLPTYRPTYQPTTGEGDPTPRPTEPRPTYRPTYMPSTGDGDPTPRPTAGPRRCPGLRELEASECPADGTVWYFSCDDPELEVGDVCKSNNGECGTSKQIDNCRYPSTRDKQKADLYLVISPDPLPYQPTPKPVDPIAACPELRELEADECPADGDVWYFSCDNPELEVDDICKSNNGECDTTKSLNNCRYPADSPKQKADLYMVVAFDGRPTPRPNANCPRLRPVPESECPEDGLVVKFSCDDPVLVTGDICKSDGGECGTDKLLNNCIYPSWTDVKTADLYYVDRGGPSPGYRPTRPPTQLACPVLEAVAQENCPTENNAVARFNCAAPDLVEGDLCKSNQGECGTDKKLDNCVYPLSHSSRTADIYRVVEAARPGGETPRPVMATYRPTGGPDQVFYVDTEVRFLEDVLDAQLPGYATDQQARDAIADALVDSEVASSRDEVLQVVWRDAMVVSDDFFDARRRLDAWRSVPAVVSLGLPASTLSTTELDEDVYATKAEVVAKRLRAAVDGDGVPRLRDSLEDHNADLADALDEGATAGMADESTVERAGPPPTRMPSSFPTRPPTRQPVRAPGSPTREPTEDVVETPRPTPKPQGGGGKKKKGGDDDEILPGLGETESIVVILLLCLLACLCCAGAAFWAQAQGYTDASSKSRAYSPDPYEPHDSHVDIEFERFDPHAREEDGARWDDRPSADDVEPADHAGEWPEAEDDAGGAWPAPEGDDRYADDMTTGTEPHFVGYQDDAPYAGQPQASARDAGNLEVQYGDPMQLGEDHGDDMTTGTDRFEDLVDAELAKRGTGFA